MWETVARSDSFEGYQYQGALGDLQLGFGFSPQARGAIGRSHFIPATNQSFLLSMMMVKRLGGAS